LDVYVVVVYIFTICSGLCSSIPLVVAVDGHVVDVLGEGVGGRRRVGLVGEGPVEFGAVVVETSARKVHPVLCQYILHMISKHISAKPLITLFLKMLIFIVLLDNFF
jgi:hypothetical protein